jgi:hypothetical protein
MITRHALITIILLLFIIIIALSSSLIVSQGDKFVCALTSSELEHHGPVPRRSRDCYHCDRAQIEGTYLSSGFRVYFGDWLNILVWLNYNTPITMSARSNAWNVFARSNTEIMGWIPLEEWMSVRVWFMLSCVGSGFVTGLIALPRSPSNCLMRSIVPD